VLAEVGGFPGEFFYGLEETDLAWRILDRGLDVLYTGDVEVVHPHVPMAQRSGAIHHTARNRVLLARRRLPVVLAAVYLPIRFGLALTNVRSWRDVRALLSGYRAGFRDARGERRPIRWATAWRMTRLGRPPVV
jgi:GT2 family glycosyltransferase